MSMPPPSATPRQEPGLGTENPYGASSAPPKGAPAPPPPPVPAPPPTEDAEALPTAYQERATAAIKVEAAKAQGVAWALTIPVVALILLAAAQAVSGTAGASGQRWISGQLALLLFLIAGQFVCAQLVWEHRRTIEEIRTAAPQPQAGRRGRWLAITIVIVFISLTVVSDWLPLKTWGQVAVFGLVAELIATGVLFAAQTRFKSHTSNLPFESPVPLTSVESAGHAEDPPSTELLAIGASGGGIRAAAFVLGGMNALQTTPRYLAQEREPEVFAVSGGSYTAAAMALRRRFSPDAAPGAPVSWREAFTVDSPELDYLRRHTRYLFEPGSRLRDGATSLIVGAVVNLFIVAVMLRGIAWLSAQVAVTVGLVTIEDGTPRLTATGFLVTVVVIAALVVALTSVLIWRTHDKYNRGKLPGDGPMTRAANLGALRASTVSAAAALILLVGIPASSVWIINAVNENRPTTTVARLLHATGFGTKDLCKDSMVRQVTAASLETGTRARLSPGTEQSVDTGACGVTVTVTRSLDNGGDNDPGNDVLTPINADQARDLTGSIPAPIQIGAIIALLGSVVGLLARGPSPDAAGQGKWFTRAKRTVLTWLPLVITVSLGAYLLLLWHVHFLLGVGWAEHVWVNAALLVAAGVPAYFLDANHTSMHQYYRERLANAFAVGVTPDGTADELAPEEIYRFSDLADGPRLNVVTTLNTQVANEVPTLRGGKPLVFGRRVVNLCDPRQCSTPVGTADYEAFAGEGRTSIMATVAMSGAAISPLVGRNASQVKPYRILLTLFNLRVGIWMLNPAQTTLVTQHGEPKPGSPGHRGALAVTSRPGLAQVALEAVGHSSAMDRWVYVSDGGHLDNTAAVECVRYALGRAPDGAHLRGQIVVLDASNDPPGAWSAIGDALNVIRADLGVDLVRKFTPGEPPWMRQFVHLSPGDTPGQESFRLIVVKAVRVDPETDAVSAQWHRQLPEAVKSTQLLRPEFPRASTVRQRFGDLEFEAYRAYGYAAVSEALAFLDNPPQPERARSRPLEARARGRT